MKRCTFLRAAEREYWRRLLRSGLSVSAIARVSGVNRTAIYRRFKLLKISVRTTKHGNAAWQALAPKTRAAFHEMADRELPRASA